MFLDTLEKTDKDILELLINNARHTYSEIGEKLGISRVSVRNHMDELERRGIIEGYTTIINPQKLTPSISCYYEIETSPETFQEVVDALNKCETVTQIYRVTGNCRLHVHAVASSEAEMESFMSECLDKLPGVRSISTNAILSRIKDVKGLRL